MLIERETALAPNADDDLFALGRDLRMLYKEEIARALDIICRDSGLNPHRYLDDTLVPHGGE